jgi:hypothetical protein
MFVTQINSRIRDYWGQRVHLGLGPDEHWVESENEHFCVQLGYIVDFFNKSVHHLP